MALIEKMEMLHKQFISRYCQVLLCHCQNRVGMSLNLYGLVNTPLILSRIHTYKHSHLFSKYTDVRYVPSTEELMHR